MISNHLPTTIELYCSVSLRKMEEDEQRRETWPETVSRYFDYMTVHLKETQVYTF